MDVWGLAMWLLVAGLIVALTLGVLAFIQVRALKAELRALKLQLGPIAPSAQVARIPPDPVAQSNEFTLDLDLTTSPPLNTRAASPSKAQPLIEKIQQNWMVWLGGVCVALAGIFLARLAAEQGLLNPLGRVSMGLVTGLVLHAIALRLRLTRGIHPSFAALAGGASITLFATLLAALHWYGLMGVQSVFSALALVAVATLWLALLHGPLLAAIGILGAYSVPALVSSGSGAMSIALIYSLLVLVMALGLYRRVSRTWLWWGAIAGALCWWLVALWSTSVDSWRGMYLFAIGLVSIFIGSPSWQDAKKGIWPLNGWRQDKLALAMSMIAVASAYNLAHTGDLGNFVDALAVPLLLMLLCGYRADWSPLTALAMAAGWLPVLVIHAHWQGGWHMQAPDVIESFTYYLLGSLAIYVGLGALGLHRFSHSQWRAAQTLLSPLCAYCIAYWIIPDALNLMHWVLIAQFIGVVYIGVAQIQGVSSPTQAVTIWLYVAGCFALGIAFTLLLDGAGLTLAFAVMMLALAWNIARLRMDALVWLVKFLILLITWRLTITPLMASQQTGSVGILVSFILTTLSCVIGAKLTERIPALTRWLEVAALHLAMLSLWLMVRYLMHSGGLFTHPITPQEMAVNLWLFGAMATIYARKSAISESLSQWYRAYANLQLAAALLQFGYLTAALLLARPWLVEAISTRAIFNLISLIYIAPIVLYLLARKYQLLPTRDWPKWLAMFSVFCLINFHIRHLWNGGIEWALPIAAGELYTYSVIWLGIAAAIMFSYRWYPSTNNYRFGMGLLLMVVVKIFLWDMAGLEGIYRIVSFMGLGLALLALGYLHQAIKLAQKK